MMIPNQRPLPSVPWLGSRTKILERSSTTFTYRLPSTQLSSLLSKTLVLILVALGCAGYFGIRGLESILSDQQWLQALDECYLFGLFLLGWWCLQTLGYETWIVDKTQPSIKIVYQMGLGRRVQHLPRQSILEVVITADYETDGYTPHRYGVVLEMASTPWFMANEWQNQPLYTTTQLPEAKAFTADLRHYLGFTAYEELLNPPDRASQKPVSQLAALRP